jgi:hypothetical protein
MIESRVKREKRRAEVHIGCGRTVIGAAHSIRPMFPGVVRRRAIRYRRSQQQPYRLPEAPTFNARKSRAPRGFVTRSILWRLVAEAIVSGDEL